ncbi:hypothetical protein [Mucilaginibacter pocheonensis]|uniref:Glycosyl hydrolases family 43 n=1 Tax=Mucilaginibacter pocheonensis TaxID=398050 RepID=A0ABU1TFR6_9SPHI|nr:hypothetical protein [Mucilaginibacter pocheonensis]MDR6944192.1 hypothetical protein [Mucilaginibacter pocheonensis]
MPEHLAYSTSKNLQVPHWTYGDTAMSVIRQGGAFMNHPGVIDYKSKTYLFYHNGALPGGGGFDRSVCVDELNLDANGGVSRVTLTPGLSQGVGTLNPFDHIQAGNHCMGAVRTPPVVCARYAVVLHIFEAEYFFVLSINQ